MVSEFKFYFHAMAQSGEEDAAAVPETKVPIGAMGFRYPKNLKIPEDPAERMTAFESWWRQFKSVGSVLGFSKLDAETQLNVFQASLGPEASIMIDNLDFEPNEDANDVALIADKLLSKFRVLSNTMLRRASLFTAKQGSAYV